jgi:putative N6-adenine-specific DNA methylase
MEIRAVCGPGLEGVLEAELKGLGLAGRRFEGGPEALYRANALSRCADRVLVRLGEFRASAFDELRRKASRLAWESVLSPGRPVAFRVDCRGSRLYHEGAVAERLAGAIADRMKKPSPVEKSGQLIFASLSENLCSIDADSSGEPLHRRGYRLEPSKAPLRETLAAAALIASGWDRASPLVDPFCGSGTIPIEAALMALGIAPGRGRRFAFMDWPGFDRAAFERVLASTARKPPPWPRIIASDRDAGALCRARGNAARAGVAEGIELSQRAFSAVDPPPGPGWVVTNPPYGVRLQGAKDLRKLYFGLGDLLRRKFRGYGAGVLCPAPRLMACAGPEFAPVLSAMNGQLPVRLYHCTIP